MPTTGSTKTAENQEDAPSVDLPRREASMAASDGICYRKRRPGSTRSASKGDRGCSSSEGKVGPGAQNGAQAARGATRDAESAEREEPEPSGIAQAPNADKLHPGRRRWRAPEATRKLCASFDVEKERGGFSGAQSEKAATVSRKSKDYLATAGGGPAVMREFRGRKSAAAREPFSEKQWAEPMEKGPLCEECASAKLSGRAANGTHELEPAPSSNREKATRFITQLARGDKLLPASRATLQVMGAATEGDTRGWAVRKDPVSTADHRWGILRLIHAEDLAHAARAAGAG